MMKITICGSMSFAQDMLVVQKHLEGAGHSCHLPEGVEEYARGAAKEGGSEGARRKIEKDLIRRHYELIQDSDAILVLNYEKRGIKNYIGGNALLEMGFAHILNKKIYLLHDIPEMEFIKQEIEAMNPIVLNGDLASI